MRYGTYSCYGEQCGRGFLTKGEKIELLKEYKENLNNEAKGVAERIKDLEEE